MMARLDQEEFERILRKYGREGKFEFDIKDSDVEFWLSKAQSVETSSTSFSDFEKMIARTIEKRKSLEQSEIRQSQTFGEFISKVEDRVNSTSGYRAMMDFLPSSVTPDTLSTIKKNRIKRFAPELFAELIMYLAFPFKECMRLLQNSFRVEQLREQKSMGDSSARIDEGHNTEERFETTQSAMEKLMLGMDSERPLAGKDEKWERFEGELTRLLRESGYIR